MFNDPPCPFCGADTSESQDRTTLRLVRGWSEDAINKLSGVKLQATACLDALTWQDDLPRIRWRMRQLINFGNFVSAD